MDMHLLLQHSKAIEHVCTQERSNAQSTKKASAKMREEARDPVWSLLTKFLRKLIPRSIATCKRNMGVHIPCTTHKIVVGMRRTEMKNPMSKRPRKAQESPIPQSSLSHNYARKWTSSRKQSRNKMLKRRNVTVAIWIPTQNRELGWVP